MKERGISVYGKDCLLLSRIYFLVYAAIAVGIRICGAMCVYALLFNSVRSNLCVEHW